MTSVIEKQMSCGSLQVLCSRIGEDLCIQVLGGEKPHIGCTVIAVPRPSLHNDGTWSCTSSVINLTGHKDEHICRALAEKACRAHHCTVVCTGGFHIDNMKPEQIQEVLDTIRTIEL